MDFNKVLFMMRSGIDPNANIEEILFAKTHSGNDPYIEKWDFRVSMTGSKGNEMTTSGTGVLQSIYGLGWQSSSGAGIIPDGLIESNIALNIKVAQMQRTGYDNICQVLCLKKGTNFNPGLCFHDGRGKWIFVDTNYNYYNSTITDPNYFNESMLRIEFRNDNSIHIFKDDVEVFVPACAMDITLFDNVSLGCYGSNQAFYKMIIETLEIIRL